MATERHASAYKTLDTQLFKLQATPTNIGFTGVISEIRILRLLLSPGLAPPPSPCPRDKTLSTTSFKSCDT